MNSHQPQQNKYTFSARKQRRVLKYKEQYLITIEGKSETVTDDDTPFGLQTLRLMLFSCVAVLNAQYKQRSVKIERVEDGKRTKH